jgi:hypothetical protein
MPAFRSVVSVLVSFAVRSFSTNSRPAPAGGRPGGSPAHESWTHEPDTTSTVLSSSGRLTGCYDARRRAACSAQAGSVMPRRATLTRTRRRHVPSERAARGPGARHSGDPCPSGAHQHHVRRVGHRLAVARNIEGAGTSKCPPLLRMRISRETACSARGKCYLHPLCRASPRLANEASGHRERASPSG